MGDILFRRKDLLGVNPEKSRAMRKLLENEKIADILDKKQEIREFRDALKKHTQNDRYITESEVRAVLAELKIGRKDSLSRNEVIGVRKAMGFSRPVDSSDLSQDSPLRKNKGSFLSTDESRVSSTKKPPLRGLPF
ncbi:MAG: hypothetical protein EOM19_00630 [Candidatus Moranbacteria bacterium]|nr:hypothetical protein [Candidatus Moranbacteria bacterium]